MRMKLSCIRIRIIHGDKPSFSVNRLSMALTAPKPSNTAPKARAASMIHINMQVIPKVFFNEVSKTFQFMRPFRQAAVNAVIAPMAELSTSDVQPFTNGIIMAKNMANGSKPESRRRYFSAFGILRSSSLSAGPRLGLCLQRIAI